MVGGVNRSWTRIVVRMQTDEGIEGIAETSGGDATLLQLRAIEGYFLGEDPFDRERILKNFWYLPTYKAIRASTRSRRSRRPASTSWARPAGARSASCSAGGCAPRSR